MKKMKKMSLWLSSLSLVIITACGGSHGGQPPGPGDPDAGEPSAGDRVVMYEAFPGMFGMQNTLQAITTRLGEMEELGVNVLWLMPVYEQGALKAIGSPYCVKDYRKVNPNYGSLADLKALVEAAHGREMRVILDWVGNHTSWDNAWITDHPEWYSHDGSGNIISPPGFNWTDVADLDYGNAAMRTAMLDAMKWWVTETGIDGYRCDYADGVPADFWTEVITELRKSKGDDLLMLAESGSAAMFDAGFDMAYGWNFASTLQGLYAGTKKASDLYVANEAEYQGVARGRQRMRHITNHDMNNENATTALYGNLRGAMSAFVIAATMGGCPMIYGSQEVGYAARPGFFGNYQMDWGQNPEYLAEYERLMEVRGASLALQANGFLATYNVDDSVVCFKRANGSEKVLVVVNTSSVAKTIRLPIEFSLGSVTDLITDGRLTTTTTLALNSYEYKLLKL